MITDSYSPRVGDKLIKGKKVLRIDDIQNDKVYCALLYLDSGGGYLLSMSTVDFAEAYRLDPPERIERATEQPMLF